MNAFIPAIFVIEKDIHINACCYICSYKTLSFNVGVLKYHMADMTLEKKHGCHAETCTN